MFFDAFGEDHTRTVEFLINLRISSEIPLKTGSRVHIPSMLPFVLNLTSLQQLSPAAVANCFLNSFIEEFVADDFFVFFICSRITWQSPWSDVLSKVLSHMAANVIEHLLNFLKKNKDSTALVYWNSDKQFLTSLAYKVMAAVRELEMLYPIDSHENLKNKEVLVDFTEDLQCCLLFCLVVELENHLKLFMIVPTSKFLIDTVKSALGNEVELSEDSCEESEDKNNPKGKSQNKALVELLESLETKKKESIFSYGYNINKRRWTPWAEFERSHIMDLESRVTVSRRADPGSVLNSEPNTPGMRRSRLSSNFKGGSFLVGRKSAGALSQNSLVNHKLDTPEIPDLIRVEYWCMLMNQYGRTL